MEVVNIEKLRRLEEEFAVAIGFFDGVHLGHQKVITHAIHYAKEHHAKSMVITFDRSPKVALGFVENDGYVTPTNEKLRILEGMGVDYALVLKLDATFLNLSADEFISEYLLKIGACYVSVGFDFRFGRGGAGNTELLLRYSEFKVNVSEAVLVVGAKVSTTEIKKCLKMGDLDLVNQMLGRPFSVSGEIVHGRQLGRMIGFPTANLKLHEDYLFSLRGVYATVSYIDGVRHASMTNVGYNPTANEATSSLLKKSDYDCLMQQELCDEGAISSHCVIDDVSVETHILNFDEDIYGKTLRVEFIIKKRDEVKFNGLDELITQLEKDKLSVKLMSI